MLRKEKAPTLLFLRMGEPRISDVSLISPVLDDGKYTVNLAGVWTSDKLSLHKY